MKEVYVVRQFFEDNHDTEYTGVYSNFWKALAAAKADQEKNWSEDTGHSLKVHKPNKFSPIDTLWCEVMDQTYPQGIYYTINRMELR